MCGIAGYFRKTLAPAVARRVSSSIAHRGPEDEGIWTGSTGDLTLTLIHRRLRILDLSAAGHQPMTRGPHTIVFNGEIYNFLELRRSLEQQGYTFSSNSDTEVILAAYDRWGVDSIPRLEGMFAFALWDDSKKELILARDRIGKKPLFFHNSGASFTFGSEIKAILAALNHTPEIDYCALDDYLTYLYIPYPRTIFAGIRQLAPATWMRLQVRGNETHAETVQYWNPLDGRPAVATRLPELESQVRELVAGAVHSRLISDAPLGVLLSGGIDSSTITAMMANSSTRRVRSFSIGFAQNKNYDEIPFAKLVADHCGAEHTVLQAEPSCSTYLANVIRHFDQPFGNPTAILTYILSALTKQSVTVALAGDGGDELFGGYPRYIGAHLSRFPRSLPGFVRNRLLPWVAGKISDDATGRHQFRRVREFLQEAGLPLIEMYLGWVGYFSPTDRAALYTPETRARVGNHDSGDFLRALFAESESLEPLNRLAYVDVKSFLCCNVLEYADRMSMAHALELRAPFTDRRLVEFSLRLPFNMKFCRAQSKWILRQAMKPLLPASILNKRKLGFNPPIGTWLNGELHNLADELLSSRRINERGLFRASAVQDLLNRHASRSRDHSLHIWALMVLELWFRLYIDGENWESVQEDIDRSTCAVPASDLLAMSA
ncbi:MAG: asparagine synthase (glutamine-hydrolyzing) [Acidobacteriaceae bacterium]|nr:asparagine synthase (glutamine-hydrolyzing) [Acidobacteriaceae bacterium]MBV9779056.1 asparagine synthase (glutamine-hydrolyzing) [Acidobacteriaceae bacterium]